MCMVFPIDKVQYSVKIKVFAIQNAMKSYLFFILNFLHTLRGHEDNYIRERDSSSLCNIERTNISIEFSFFLPLFVFYNFIATGLLSYRYQ